MTDEMKLLKALCEALGFDVEKTSEWAFHEYPAGDVPYQIFDYKLTKRSMTNDPR